MTARQATPELHYLFTPLNAALARIDSKSNDIEIDRMWMRLVFLIF